MVNIILNDGKKLMGKTLKKIYIVDLSEIEAIQGKLKSTSKILTF